MAIEFNKAVGLKLNVKIFLDLFSISARVQKNYKDIFLIIF